MVIVICVSTIFSYFYQSSPRLRLQQFDIRLENESRVGTPIRRYLPVSNCPGFLQNSFKMTTGSVMSERRQKRTKTNTLECQMTHSDLKQVNIITSGSPQPWASSLHWTILLLFYALFLQWSMIATESKSPFPLSKSPILSAQTIILCAPTQCSFVSHTRICKPCSPLFLSCFVVTDWDAGLTQNISPFYSLCTPEK